MSSVVENTLPEGWKMLKLSDVCDLLNGYAFKAKEYVEKSNTVIIRMGNIRPNGTFDIEHKIKYLPNKYSEELTRYRLYDGDLVIAMTDLASEMRILGNPTLIKGSDGRNLMLNQRVGKLHKFNFNLITKEYLRFILTSKQIKDYYKSLGGGGLQINIGKQQILSVTIPTPPLEEQKRIVAKIDTLFAKINKAISLTEESLKQAENLLPSVLKEVFEKGKTDGWEEKKLEDVCEKITDGSHNPPKSCEGSKLMMLSGRNVRDNKLDFEKVRFVSEKDFIKEDKRTSIKGGDVLLTIVGSIGRSFVFPEGIPKVIFQRSVAVIKPYSILNPYFLSYFLKSPKTQEQLNTEARGAAQKGVYLKDIRAFIILFPNIDIQRENVYFLDKVSLKSKQTQSKLKEQLAYLKQLKSSILSKAFKGEL